MKTTTLLSSLCITFFISTASAISLRNRHDSPPRVINLPVKRNHIPDRVAHDRTRLSRRDNIVNTALDNLDTYYSLDITLGTPEQVFRVDIDTGSSDLWVNSPGSSVCSSRENPCDGFGTYDANSSSTYSYVNSVFNITYASGQGAVGDYATDDLRVAGETVKGLQFGIGYDSSSAQGILGIGYALNEAQSADTGLKPYENLPTRMVSDGLIASPAYSLWLNDLESNTGSLLFGGVDRAQYHGELATLPVQQSNGAFSEFFVALSSMELAGQPLADNMDLSVLLDSGTSLTYLPDDIVATIFDMASAEYDSSSGTALVPCSLANESGNMTFSFGSAATIDVAISELVLQDTAPNQNGDVSSGNGGSACLFGIAPAGDGGISILGDTFLRSAYVVFDLANNEISMAQSNFDPRGSDIAEIASGGGGVTSAAAAPSSFMSGTLAAPTASATGDSGAGDDSAAGAVTLSGVGLSLAVLLSFVGLLL